VGAVSDSAEDRSAGEPFAVRVPDYGAAGSGSGAAGAVAGRREDRDAAGVRREYHSAAWIPEYREARARGVDGLGRDYAGHVLYWGVPGADSGDDRVRAGDVRELLSDGAEEWAFGEFGSDGVKNSTEAGYPYQRRSYLVS